MEGKIRDFISELKSSYDLDSAHCISLNILSTLTFDTENGYKRFMEDMKKELLTQRLVDIICDADLLSTVGLGKEDISMIFRVVNNEGFDDQYANILKSGASKRSLIVQTDLKLGKPKPEIPATVANTKCNKPKSEIPATAIQKSAEHTSNRITTDEDPDIKFAQVLISCNHCSNKVELFCNSCEDKLCSGCVGQHIQSPFPQHHDVKMYSDKFDVNPKPFCPNHIDQKCDLYCKQCESPVCSECIALKKHWNHELKTNLEIIRRKAEIIQKESKIVEEKISPKYERIIKQIQSNITNLPESNSKLKSEVIKQGQTIQDVVMKIVNQQLSNIEAMENQDLEKLKRNLSQFQDLSNAAKDTLKSNRQLLQSKRSSIIHFQPRINKFIQMPSQTMVSPGTFNPVAVHEKQIYSLFGELQPSTTTAISEDEDMNKIINELSLLSSYYKELLDRPVVIATINTKRTPLFRVSWIKDNQAWISGFDNTMTRVDIQGSVLERVKTKSGRMPGGLTVTKEGELLYTDFYDNSINLVKCGKIQTLFKTEWKPSGIFCTSSRDILVALCKQGLWQKFKIVRYCNGSIITVVMNEKHQKLFQEEGLRTCLQLTQNINGDLCILDWNARALLILSNIGKLKSRYSGSSTLKRKFDPGLIITDSQGHILVSDIDNHCVHILNINGRILSLIRECGLIFPMGVSIDSIDRLWVVERDSGKLKIVKYMD